MPNRLILHDFCIYIDLIDSINFVAKSRVRGIQLKTLCLRELCLPCVAMSWMSLQLGPWVILSLMLLLIGLIWATVVVALKSLRQRERRFSNESVC
jgi:hypothetical protein